MGSYAPGYWATNALEGFANGPNGANRCRSSSLRHAPNLGGKGYAECFFSRGASRDTFFGPRAYTKTFG